MCRTHQGCSGRPESSRTRASGSAHTGRVLAGATDRELVSAARAGEVAALGELFERYRPSLYAAALARLRDRDEALDQVQETFLIALTRMNELRDPDAVGGWLHAVLRNSCLMRLRRAGREVLTGEVADAVLSAEAESCSSGAHSATGSGPH
jgi:DNA-directed RNA polymerase specialized sigma24 family protein